MTPDALNAALCPYLPAGWPLVTRFHAANQYFPNDCWIKREDELSAGIIGSKFRKFASLTAFWQQYGTSNLTIWGSLFSNNVMGLLQLANEHELSYELCLLADRPGSTPYGNHLWLQTLTRSGTRVHYFSRSLWHQQVLPRSLVQGQHMTIPEGAGMLEALPGCLTLGLDIAYQEMEKGLSFNHLFIDSGSGLTAIGLLLALGYMRMTDKTVHITLMAGSEARFCQTLEQFRKQLSRLSPALSSVPETPQFYCYQPPTARAFGSVNRTVLTQLNAFAKQEGILTDPIYGAKHAYTAARLMQQKKLSGPKLFIHNGGGLGIAGFQEQLAKTYA